MFTNLLPLGMHSHGREIRIITANRKNGLRNCFLLGFMLELTNSGERLFKIQKDNIFKVVAVVSRKACGKYTVVLRILAFA